MILLKLAIHHLKDNKGCPTWELVFSMNGTRVLKCKDLDSLFLQNPSL